MSRWAADANGRRYGTDTAKPTRRVTETCEGHSQRYIERFRAVAAGGGDHERKPATSTRGFTKEHRRSMGELSGAR